jgi:hypothetical protein
MVSVRGVGVGVGLAFSTGVAVFTLSVDVGEYVLVILGEAGMAGECRVQPQSETRIMVNHDTRRNTERKMLFSSG